MALKIFILAYLFGLLLSPTCGQIALGLVSASSLSATGLHSAPKNSIGMRSMASHGLMSKWSSIGKSNNTNREMDIAAVFRGVAYGAPTSSSTTTTTTSTTTSPTTTTTTTRALIKEDIFIGHRADAAIPFEPSEATLNREVFEHRVHDTERNFESNHALTYIVETEKSYFNKEREEIEIKPTMPSTIDIRESHTMYIKPTHVVSTFAIPTVKFHTTYKFSLNDYQSIRKEVGTAWNVHVYATAICFTLVALASICCLFRINSCSHLLPRGYYVTLHLMIFLAAFFRCIIFFHDPYSANHRLPPVLALMLYNTVIPCITTGFAVLFMVMLRAARISILPFNLQSPLFLTIVCGVYIGGSVMIDITVPVMNEDWLSIILPASIQSLIVVWNVLMWFTYFILYPKIEKAALRQQSEMVRLTFTRVHLEGAPLARKTGQPSFAISAKWFLFTSVCQVLWCIITIYNVFGPKVNDLDTPSQAWSWWVKSCVEKALEVIVCFALLGTAYWLTQSKPKDSRKGRDQQIFSIFKNCGKKDGKRHKDSDVYPVSNEKSMFLGNYTLSQKFDDTLKSKSNHTNEWASPVHAGYRPTIGNKDTLHSVTSDFQMVWNKTMNHYTEPGQTSTMLVNDSGFVRFKKELDKKSETHIDPTTNQKILMVEVPPAYTTLHSYSYTLPGNKYYCNNNEVCTPQNELPPMNKSHTLRNSKRTKQANTNQNIPSGNQLPNGNVSSVSTYNIQNEPRYEVAPYYNAKSEYNEIYSTPQFIYSHKYPVYNKQPQVHGNNLHPNYQFDKESGMFDPSTYSSQSEIHVDYLTDVSSSNDGLNETSLPRKLPLSIKPVYTSSPISDVPLENAQLDITPDSAVVIDYSSQNEEDEKNGRNDLRNHMTLDLIKMNSSSLNDVIKNQSGIFSKLVNTANPSNSVAYTPLELEENSSPSQELPKFSDKNEVSNCPINNLNNKNSIYKEQGTISPMTAL